MNVFVTGATGWIGSAVAEELLGHGHEVTGLARSDASASLLQARGVRPLRGDLDDPDSVRAGAEKADAVIHLAFKHDFTDLQASARAERDAVAAIGDVLAGSSRRFLLAAATTFLAPGRTLTERDRSPFYGLETPRGGDENLALEYAGRGVDVRSIRFAPTVHGKGDTGFTATLVATARAKGVSGYVGDGTTRWAAVHRRDAARVVRLGLERELSPGTVLHAVAETGIASREIAEAIGRALGVPAASIPAGEAAGHFGWLAMFFGLDIAASSDATQAALAWTPEGPALLEDLAAGSYTAR
jgi:nucleoside-diphosphate-sugar epimerase